MSEPDNQQTTKERPFVNNQLDFNLEVIEPSWGTATPTMLNKSGGKVRYLTSKDGKYEGTLPLDGQVFINVDDILSNLDFFTKDIRLSNLDKEDIKQARWYLDFAIVLAHNKYFGAFNYCVGKVASICETSQGRGGFLRKMFNTFRNESISTPLEPAKKNFFTGKTSGGGQ